MKFFGKETINEKTKYYVLYIPIFKIKIKNSIKEYYFLWIKLYSKKIKDNFYSLIQQNTVLKNSTKKKRCFVCATGPSIKEQNLLALKGEDCFSISNFFLHKDIKEIAPKLHFFAPYHPPLVLENYIEWLNIADKELPEETAIVLGVNNEYLVKQYNLFPKRQIFYVELGEVNPDAPINVDLTLPIMAPQTGPIMILPVCAYMGYEEIYLIGQDMNRLASYGATTPNFYQNDKDPRVNATDSGNWIDIIPEMERTLVMFKQFKKYSDYFKEKNIKLYNLSPNSWLSFIEKKDFDEVLTTNKEIN